MNHTPQASTDSAEVSGQSHSPIVPDDILKKYRQFTGQEFPDLERGQRGERLRAANYIRLSKEDSESHSLDTQPDRSGEYIRQCGWQLVDVYEDEATGRNSKRPGLKRLRDSIIAGKIDVLVVHRLDRLFRNLEALLKFIRFLKAHQVKLVSVTESIDTDTEWGYLVIYVLGGLAEYYVRNLSRRTSEGKLTRIKKGLLNGAYRYGYCNGRCSACTDPNGADYCPRFGQPDLGDGRIPVPHPLESLAVRLIFEWYRTGEYSHADIAQLLNQYDYHLPDGSTVHFRTKGLPGQTEPGPFGRDNIRLILNNPVYAGVAAHYPSRPLTWEE